MSTCENCHRPHAKHVRPWWMQDDPRPECGVQTCSQTGVMDMYVQLAAGECKVARERWLVTENARLTAEVERLTAKLAEVASPQWDNNFLYQTRKELRASVFENDTSTKFPEPTWCATLVEREDSQAWETPIGNFATEDEAKSAVEKAFAKRDS